MLGFLGRYPVLARIGGGGAVRRCGRACSSPLGSESPEPTVRAGPPRRGPTSSSRLCEERAVVPDMARTSPASAWDTRPRKVGVAHVGLSGRSAHE
jgi:hypothetical protein